jgi:hypothetical protein
MTVTLSPWLAAALPLCLLLTKVEDESRETAEATSERP